MIGKIVSGLLFGVVAAVASAFFDDKLSFPYIVAGVTIGVLADDITWREVWRDRSARFNALPEIAGNTPQLNANGYFERSPVFSGAAA